MARLSPTRIISMPAASPTKPLGKSCAVIMVIGSPFLYIDRKELIVTFFRVGGADPIGECELNLPCLLSNGGARSLTIAGAAGRVHWKSKARDALTTDDVRDMADNRGGGPDGCIGEVSSKGASE
jgi:hypothetical protein